mmetsp:Transcript_24877/g.53665  ORF Transcript_24877/g.53665 Transcript_24877/m.53665 type:complete len:231 (+) Transcript_24877:561-1253(+)
MIFPRTVILVEGQDIEVKPQCNQLVELGNHILRKLLRPRLPILVQRAHVCGPTAQVRAVFVIVINVEVASVLPERFHLLDALFPGQAWYGVDIARAGPAATFGTLELKIDALELLYSFFVEFGGCPLFIRPVFIMKPTNPLEKLVLLLSLFAIPHIAIRIHLFRHGTRHLKIPMFLMIFHKMLEPIIPTHGRILTQIERVTNGLHARCLLGHELGIPLAIECTLIVEPFA